MAGSDQPRSDMSLMFDDIKERTLDCLDPHRVADLVGAVGKQQALLVLDTIASS
jgi:hypothetical protein